MSIRIGMLRAKGKPDSLALAVAHAAAMQGADLVFFTPSDVDVPNRSIDALVYRDSTWARVKTGFPDVIDNDERSRASTSVWDALTEEVPITTPQLGGKLGVMKRMDAAGLYSELQIPTALITRFGDVIDFLGRYRKIVTKPVHGAQGRDISFFSCEEGDYEANIGGKIQRLGRAGLECFYGASIRGRNYLVQKYIESKTQADLPFDIRLHVRRNRFAQWETVRIYARIGAGQTITSNLSAGGSIMAASVLLKSEFGKRSDALLARLREIARDFPPRFQDLYDDRVIDALGIDIGIDRDGKCWIFEVNSYPGAEYLEMDDAVPRVGYALHLAEQFRRSRQIQVDGEE